MELSEKSSAKSILTQSYSHIILTCEERLFLRMIFQEGMTVAAAGSLFAWSQKQSHKRLEKLLARVRNGIECAGLHGELKALLAAECDV